MSADRPINADVTPPEQGPEQVAEPKTVQAIPGRDRKEATDAPETAEEPPAETAGADEPPPAPRRRRHSPIPGPIKLVAVLVVVAIGFIVLAIVGGSGSKKGGGSAAPAPAATTTAAGDSTSPESSAESGSEGAGGGQTATAEELGYPAFATSNTTRIGGPDPVADAAATALAVFPSTNEKQRPVAVALASTEDWAGALAAGVLMAEPIRAPLLFGEAEGVPAATASALEALQPRGGAASGGDAVLAIGDVAVPHGMSAAKVKAGDAASEAAAIARLRDRLAGHKPDAIVLASSTEPAYAAPAAAYAARSGDPILFTEAETLSQPTVAELRRDEGVPVFALGPTSAISGEVLKEVEELGAKVTRISGSNPVQSAISFARYEGKKFGWHVSDPGHGFVLGRSDAPLEAAAAAPLSASGTWGPLLLTDSADTLPSELRGYFLDVKPGYTTDPTRAFYNHVWIIGDTGQISVEQQAEVNEIAELAKIGNEE
ncbi:MAG TPA: cell wall-binding repeat-containing protein [Solirubrobacterales bacterium]|nr:cell wall-binding repeat-containing protein [Solirubrobacterales bacterium]